MLINRHQFEPGGGTSVPVVLDSLRSNANLTYQPAEKGVQRSEAPNPGGSGCPPDTDSPPSRPGMS